MKRLLLKMLGYDLKVIDNVFNKYDKLTHFIDCNCVMIDDNGHSEGEYNSEDVARKWNEFNNLTDEMNNALRKLR